jgi:SAM-dependent methyltransferase
LSELLLGCGNSRAKKKTFDSFEWQELTTLDHDPNCGADVIHDLGSREAYPFADDQFDEVHAYEVLEHIGQQGDFRKFFHDFGEIYRILKPGGHLFATCPRWDSIWAWGDPSHTRIISRASLVFLNQEQYRNQIGKTAMTDFRWLWKGDFEPVHMDEDDGFTFVLKAHKPPRI